MAALLLVPLSAVAAGTDAPAPVASGSGSAYEHDAGSPLHQPDCTIPASGQDFCCHLAPPCPQATGPVRSLDDDQPALAVDPAAAFAVQKAGMRSIIRSAQVPTTGPPRFILFGNFRS